MSQLEERRILQGVDELGRVWLPQAFRARVDIPAGSYVIVSLTKNTIEVTPSALREKCAVEGGYCRAVDQGGYLVLPKAYRQALGIQTQAQLHCPQTNTSITITKP